MHYDMILGSRAVFRSTPGQTHASPAFIFVREGKIAGVYAPKELYAFLQKAHPTVDLDRDLAKLQVGKAFDLQTMSELDLYTLLARLIERLWADGGDGKIPFIDYGSSLILPGLVDCHTHLVHGGNRARELGMKLEGKDYMAIREAGGGIISTVKATRAASFDELYEKAKADLVSMMLHGTSSVEAKSGYGLNKDDEIKQLKVTQKLQETMPVKLVSTYLGAHDVPPEYQGNKEGYIDFIIEQMIPLVKKEHLAEYFDVFCEKGIFSYEDTKKLCLAAKEAGFGLKIHADEIAPLGGSSLAAELGAVSTEHLMVITDEDIKNLANSDTVAVVLPATSYYLMVKDFAPAKKMWEAGCTVAIGSDYNPGSSPCENLQAAMSQACFNLRLQPWQIVQGVTIHAAKAIGRADRVGSLEEGKDADFAIFDVHDLDELFYHFSVNHLQALYIDGHKWVEHQQILAPQ